jgi:hypothetical protein
MTRPLAAYAAFSAVEDAREAALSK